MYAVIYLINKIIGSIIEAIITKNRLLGINMDYEDVMMVDIANPRDVEEEVKDLGIKVFDIVIRKATKEVRDYIHQLEKENEKLQMRNEMLRKDIDSFIQDNKIDYKSKYEQLENIIKEAMDICQPLMEWGECTINGKILKQIYDKLNKGSESDD